jgi:pimeloyl-ACP methyl ester carboxylesterase
MATFLIVHGSWHWGGCFLKVANVLTQRGHCVIAPDLATHGYDPTEPGTVADMDQYTATARAMLVAVNEPVILVGHSMGGATCTYLGEQMSENILSLVYLTAFMCPNGKCPNDYIFAQDYVDDPMAVELFQVLSADPLGVRLDLAKPDLVKEAFYADCNDRDFGVACRSVIPVTPDAPYKTLSSTTPERYGRLRRYYIECENDKAIPLSAQRKMQRDVPGAKVMTLPTSHSPFFSQPGQLANFLEATAA